MAVFASINVVLDSFMGLPGLSSGVWYSWFFIVEPINGIILGPYAGFLSSLIGVIVGHTIYFRDIYEFLFTLGAPIGAMFSGLLFRGRWKVALIYYTALLGIYFITPVAWQLPIWGIWDIYVSYAILLLVAVMATRKGLWNSRSRGRSSVHVIALSALIGLEADILFRIFLFIPGRTYQLFYGLGAEDLVPLWVIAAAVTPIKVAISILFTTIVAPSLIKVIGRIGILEEEVFSSV